MVQGHTSALRRNKKPSNHLCLWEKTTTKNPTTVFSPEAEGMAMVKRKKKIETDLPKLLSLTDSPQRAIFWHCIMRNEALERERAVANFPIATFCFFFILFYLWLQPQLVQCKKPCLITWKFPEICWLCSFQFKLSQEPFRISSETFLPFATQITYLFDLILLIY